MKRFFAALAFYFITITVTGQTPKINNLRYQIRLAADDRVKLQYILALCDQHESLPTDTAWYYALRARLLAIKLNDDISLSRAKIAQASAYLQWNNPDSARALITPEIAKYKIQNAATRHLYFQLLQKEIDCNDQDSYFKAGYARVYNIMRLAEKYKDSVVIAESMNTLGAWNYDMDFVDRAITWEYRGIAHCSTKNPKFNEVLAGLYLNLAGDYNWIHKPDSAAYFTNKSILLSQQTQNLLMLSYAWETVANTFKGQKDYIKAEQAMIKNLEITKNIYGNIPQQRQLLTLASIYRFSGRTDQAIKILKDGLIADSLYNYHSPHSPKNVGSKDLQLIFYYEELARNYRIKRDFKNYSAMLERIVRGKDSLYAANTTRDMADMGVKYESQKKEATIARQQLALAKKNYLIYGSVVFLLLASIIVWLVFKEVRRKHKLRITLLQEDEKRIAMQAVASAKEKERKRIAADLHDNLGAQLSYIKRNINYIIDRPIGFERGDERKVLTDVNDIAKNAMIDLRETIWVLNKDEIKLQDFADKLKSYLQQQLTANELIRWDFKESVTGNWKLTSGEVMHLFRIMQEVISNVIKHADATYISILLESSFTGHYLLRVTDNGKGFDTDERLADHYGLENIEVRAREIGTTLSIKSDHQFGTSVTLTKH